MAIAINGAGTITGLIAGGLPDDSIVDADIVGMTSSKLSGTLPAISGTNLTNLDATDLVGAVPTAALSNIEGKGADIASAGTMVIGTDGGYFDITGTTGITAMTVVAGRQFTLQFDAAVVLTNSSTLKLSGAANFTTAAGDHLTFVSVAANDVRQVGFGLTSGGSPVAAAGGFTLATPQATTSGTSKIFGSIPSGTNHIIVTFNGVLFTGGPIDNLQVKLGDSGGIESGGYVGLRGEIKASPNLQDTANGFELKSTSSHYAFHGQMILTLESSATNTWAAFGFAQLDSQEIIASGVGTKTLSGELTQLQIAGTGGGTFSAGEVNILYI